MAGQQPPPPPPPRQLLPPIIADANADCSIGLCNDYCPQWCYAPPNPLYRSSFDADDPDDPGPGLSPVVVVVIAFLAAALLLTSAYFFLHRYRRRNTTTTTNNNNNRPLNSAPDPGLAGGLDESLIDTIAVCRYRRGEGLVGGTSCSVCLSDFREEERLRLLPNCSHAFHVACVDSWLKSHPNCPLCRAGIAWASPPAPRRAEVAVAAEGGSGTDGGDEDDAGKRINNSGGAEFGNGGSRPVRRPSSTGDGSLITGTASAPVARSLSCGRSSFDRRREGGVQPV